MRLRRLGRRRIVVLATVVVVGVLAARALDSSSRLGYYRLIDERTLIVGTDVGPGSWTRVTSMVETSSAITVAVSSFLLRPGPGTAEAIPAELTVNLRDPLGGRAVIDTSTGLPIQRTNCPPAYFMAGCAP
jgi:hypothetical protein